MVTMPPRLSDGLYTVPTAALKAGVTLAVFGGTAPWQALSPNASVTHTAIGVSRLVICHPCPTLTMRRRPPAGDLLSLRPRIASRSGEPQDSDGREVAGMV